MPEESNAADMHSGFSAARVAIRPYGWRQTICARRQSPHDRRLCWWEGDRDGIGLEQPHSSTHSVESKTVDRFVALNAGDAWVRARTIAVRTHTSTTNARKNEIKSRPHFSHAEPIPRQLILTGGRARHSLSFYSVAPTREFAPSDEA